VGLWYYPTKNGPHNMSPAITLKPKLLL
jgi:hypothetical protein